MKARVIAAGKIVDVVANGNYYDTTDNKERYYSHELDFNDTADYWTRLEHQYAGMAMQGLCANAKFMQDHEGDFQCHEEMIAEYAKDIAHTLVEKYKEKEK